MGDSENELGSIPDKLIRGIEARVLILIIKAYKNMCEEKCYPSVKHEIYFSAILKRYIERLCPEYEKVTRYSWDVIREGVHDNEAIQTGQADPNAAPRIDIVIKCWKPLGGQRWRFPFESKNLIEGDNELIKKYIKEGLIDRYLNSSKDYASGKPWGGMIGYILEGSSDVIVNKLNLQIEKQIGNPVEYIALDKPIEGFQNIYKSMHQRSFNSNALIITHLFFDFIVTSSISTAKEHKTTA